MNTGYYCPLCSRELHEPTTEFHHLVPRTFKGKDGINIHRICHQKIHATFTERELLHYYHTVERLLENEEIVKFVKWVKKKPVEYYNKNDQTKQRKGKNKR